MCNKDCVHCKFNPEGYEVWANNSKLDCMLEHGLQYDDFNYEVVAEEVKLFE